MVDSIAVRAMNGFDPFRIDRFIAEAHAKHLKMRAALEAYKAGKITHAELYKELNLL